MFNQYPNPLHNPYYNASYGFPSPFEFYNTRMAQAQRNMMRDVQPLVIPRPLPPGSVSPIMYKPVPVVYEGDRVILGGGPQFPLPREIGELMTQERLSELMTGESKNEPRERVSPRETVGTTKD